MRRADRYSAWHHIESCAVPEDVQELGRRGVAAVKRWLEATTYLELPFDAYNHAVDCLIAHSAGVKQFDLDGYYLTDDKDPITVECKAYTTTGAQYREFRLFLAIAYSSTWEERSKFAGKYRKRHFLWVTKHPFSLGKWPVLESHDEMRDALILHPEYLAGEEMDENLLRDVSSRIMVLVYSDKQSALSLTPDELRRVRTQLDRKAREL
jgi:hypothetical protein